MRYWTFAEIETETGAAPRTIRRAWAAIKAGLMAHHKTGAGGRTELDQVAHDGLVSRLAAGQRPVRGQGQTVPDELAAIREDNRRLMALVEEQARTAAEERRRFDTIVMNLSNQLNEIRLALPAPPQEAEKQEPQSSPGPFVVLKSVWRDFVGWLDSPYPQKA